jgi:group I intron endonuclease
MTPRVFTLYCHINRVNGKRYVGQTVDSMELRWKRHIQDASKRKGPPVFAAAIRKYGEDVFEHQVLEVVATRAEANEAEVKWIKQLNCRVPHGYNLAGGAGALEYAHETTRALIGSIVRARYQKMTAEQKAELFSRSIHMWTPDRRVRARALMQSEEQRESIAAGHKRYWAKLSPEERSEVLRHKLSSMSPKAKSERVRKQWANMTPEAREARLREFVERAIEKNKSPEFSKKMSDWQTANQATLTPEEKLEVKAKAWATRREKYGPKGSKEISFEQYSEASKRGQASMTPEKRSERAVKIWAARKERYGDKLCEILQSVWANKTPEVRAEHGQKVWEARRRAKEERMFARQPRLLFNLLDPRVQATP